MQPQYPQQYPPQFPVQPGYAPQYPPAPAQPQYPPQYGQPAYPPQYGQPAYAPPPPPVPLPKGSLDDFYDQPSAGAAAFKFMDVNRQPQIGKSYAGIVARSITNADVRAQTDQNGRPQTYKDGRPKFVLVVPMLVQPSQEFPEGQAGWWVKGQARDELARAMAEAGAPAGAPEAGAGIRVTLVGVRPVPNMNPAYQYRIEYMRPHGASYAAGTVAAPPVAQPVVPAQVPMPQPVPAQTAPAPTAIPAGFDAEQAALFAKLTGQPAPAAS